jgi:uncharacterized protein (DUF2141 family)
MPIRGHGELDSSLLSASANGGLLPSCAAPRYVRAMRRWLWLVLTFAAPCEVFAATPGEINVDMAGFRSDRGRAYVALWRSAKHFPGTPPAGTATRVVVVLHGAARARFAAVEPGSFAITVFHDEDGDQELGENFLGIPNEGIGFSRNVRPRFRAPRYREAELVLQPSEHRTVEIEMLYL